jgi:hypothetical protein
LPTSWHCFKDLEDQRERFERQHLEAQQQRDVTMRAGLEARENLDRALATPTPETEAPPQENTPPGAEDAAGAAANRGWCRPGGHARQVADPDG